MKLQSIDKSTYRHKLNRIIVGFVLGFAALSILFGTLFIELFTFGDIPQTLAEGEEPRSNFKFNLAGVIVGLVVSGAVLHRLRETTYFTEVYYVWQVKQVQNLIYRKLSKINKAAFEQHDADAMRILNYYYESLKQVYQLDDNTLTMTKVNNDHQKVVELAESHHISFENYEFDKAQLAQF